jgi:LuxR family transcriptional regulator, maltose regulon positive regulatory protein
MTALGANPGSVRRADRRPRLRVLGALPTADAPAVLERAALVRRLTAAPAASVTLLVAPAGYGKSTLLREWSAADGRPFAWVRVAHREDEPERLEKSISTELRSAGVCGGVSGDESFVLVLDDAHELRRRETLQAVAELIDDLGPNGHVVVAARQRPGLPLARLRAERRLVELGAADLAFSRSEVTEMAVASGLRLGPAGCELLARSTDGWPAGVYLAALAIRDEPAPDEALAVFGGADRLVAEYLRAEVFSSIPKRSLDFLRCSSILDRLAAPLCDYVLERHDSAQLLRELARADLLLPLDRTESEYRPQRLVSDALRSDLKRDAPELEMTLHSRASQWYESRGEGARAMEHALAAGDLERAGSLLWHEAPSLVAYGRREVLAARLGHFSEHQIESCVPVALSGAAAHLAVGDRANAEQSVATATCLAGRADKALAAGARAFAAGMSATSLREMRKAAADAYAATPENSPWRALACLAEGVSLHLGGDRDAARRWLDEGARRGAAAAPAVQVLCLAQLALVAADEDDWDEAAALADRARAQTARVGIHDYPTSALVFAVSSAVRAHFGRVEACERDAREADRLLAELVGFVPWYLAECRVALACAWLRLGDTTRACTLVAEAERDLKLMPARTSAHAALDACRRQCDELAAARDSGDDLLTSAELKVLQFLPTHLSFREIADELFVSRNTVKTHVRALYRKLSVACRNDAVRRARETGLLGSTP